MAFFNTDGMGNSMLGGVSQFGSNMFSSWFNNFLAEQRENRAREANYKYNEMAAKEADKRQRAQYKDLYSPQAQMQQLQEAGLSPSIYASGGMAGKSGAGAIMGNGASGVNPNMYAAQPVSALEAAQIAQLSAETEKTKTETENISKDTELKGQEIINIIADSKNKGIQFRLMTAQSDLAEINAETAAQTMQTSIERAYYNTQKAAAEVRSQIVKADLDEATFECAYQMAYANLNNVLSDTALQKSEIGLNKAQIKEIAERIRNSQWQTWQIEKEENRKDAIFQLDKKKLETEVKMFIMEQNVELSKAQIDMVSDLVGYICNFASVGLSNVTKLMQTEMYTKTQKEIANRPRTSHTQNYTINKKGQKVIRSGKYQKTE